ncbi:MAG TPA: hypothetical protein VGO00_02835 [Kofleriaceae bacterium]|jgi:hypothetical protein|nr:hypothetical protein [Kofleriaceae bacterium]
MRIRALALAVVVVATGSCTHAQAPKARLAGEIVAIAGVVGMIAAGVIAKTSTYDSTWMSESSALVSVVGIATFATGDLTEPEDSGPDWPTRHRWAKVWIERARGAANSGDCERVQAIEPRVLRLDPKAHDIVFMRDAAIATCFPR